MEPPVATADAGAGSVEAMKIDAAEPSRPSFTTVPLKAAESEKIKIGEFLERCHYCKKRIAQNSEVFMYSVLCAFCSAECRDSQIALDKSGKRNP